jgi:hypothetical protein
MTMMVTTDRRLVELIGRRREWLRAHGVREVDVYTDEQILVDALALLHGIMDELGAGPGNIVPNLRDMMMTGRRTYSFEWEWMDGPAVPIERGASPSAPEMREPNGDG